jgi:hypothetical protein
MTATLLIGTIGITALMLMVVLGIADLVGAWRKRRGSKSKPPCES